MSPIANRVKNGKAFEYAILSEYASHISAMGVNISIVANDPYATAKSFFESQPLSEQKRFAESAKATIDTIIKLEPGLTSPKGEDDVLYVSLAADADGQQGDVRDIVFKRKSANWEVGFSAKNNHDAIKHSRLSNQLDFGKEWFGKYCSQQYWTDILPIFDKTSEYKKQGLAWSEVPNKSTEIYLPILRAFKNEVLRLSDTYNDVPALLIKYLIGKYPFYKIIKDDRCNLVVVKAFNIEGKLNKTVNGISARYKTPRLNLPHRIVEFEMKENSDTTLIMILDEGWEISFRIHNASTQVESSLKFDIQLLGNPPILFTQHLFQ